MPKILGFLASYFKAVSVLCTNSPCCSHIIRSTMDAEIQVDPQCTHDPLNPWHTSVTRLNTLDVVISLALTDTPPLPHPPH